ncbi:MAG: TonB-dependent receptor [Gammaproteobacteria bacterium]|nr:TonB-dependent receptor [Gammaproteobacteria bacterium]
MHSRSRHCATDAVASTYAPRPGGSRSKIGLAVAAALAGIAVPRAPALADAADTGPPSGAAGGLHEVVVTARKVEENLQSVPISIDVFTQKDLSNLAVNNMEDYLQRVPSISYISTGPGTQVFVMRGVSDGSNPTLANTSSTGFFVDDVSMSYEGAQPDLHLYDVERIEILNGPQGTTFGAGSMSGAIRYITNKPDLHAFSAGVDFDGGQIQGAQQNWSFQGFVNIPIIDGALGFRASAFSDSHGGFINNQLTTRTWVNQSVSNNAEWARNDYNRENVEGGRAALKAQFSESWSALLTYGFQRQHTLGAWDEDPTLPPRTVARFGPESNLFESDILEFRVDGDVGIGDLVYIGGYWKQERRQWNEYSQYMQNFNWAAGATAPYGPPADPPFYPGFPGTQEGYTCLNDPFWGGGKYTGCKPPLQYFAYNNNPERYSNEVRLSSKPGGRFHWLAGFYWERTTNKDYGETYYMPGLQPNGAAFQFYASYYYGQTNSSLPPGVWYAYTETSHILQTTEFANINFDVTDKLNVEAGIVHFKDEERYDTPSFSFAYGPNTPSDYTQDSHKVNGRAGISYKATDHAMVYGVWSQGFRPGGSNSGFTSNCYGNGVPTLYNPDTLNNYEFGWKTTSLENRLLWNGAVYYMDWKDLQAYIYDALVCASSSYNINVGDARIYGAETNIAYQITDNLTLQASANYTQGSVISAATPAYEPYVGERLPFSPYFNWSWNARYEHPLGTELRGYFQFDMAHKGDMYNGLNPNDKNTGLPRILQPAYTLMNLRLGLNPVGSKWLAEFYITNLTDKNAIVYSNTGNFDLRLTTNEPRVYGLRLSYRFGKGAVGAD